MVILDFPQRSEEWYAARLGKPSASRFGEIVTSKGEPSKQRDKYMKELAVERITGRPLTSFTSAAMERGIELEAEARSWFGFAYDKEVVEVGLVMPEHGGWCCSPDGMMDGATLEIKCPQAHTHVDYLLAGKLPTEYFQQVHGQMMICKVDRAYFVSYFPGMKSLVVEIQRDDEFCARLFEELEVFCQQLDELTEKLRGL